MRRSSAQPQDPESEGARQERDIIAGDKARLEAEMISIADTNKRLRSEGEAEKEKLDKEITEKRASVSREIASLNKLIEDKIALNDKLEFRSKTLIESNSSLVKQNDDLIKRNDNLSVVFNDFNEKIKQANVEKAKLEREISKHTGEIKILNETNSGLQHTVFVLETKIKDMTKEILSLQSKIDDNKISIENSNLNVTEASKKLNQIVIDLSSKNKELQDLNIEIEKSKQVISDHQIEITRQTDELNEKTKNYKLLEQRVDEKLELFARFKEKFTVDELAKMKVHANLV